MNDYLKVPLVNAIGGSWIAARKQIADGDWDAITRQSAQAVAKLKELSDG